MMIGAAADPVERHRLVRLAGEVQARQAERDRAPRGTAPAVSAS